MGVKKRVSRKSEIFLTIVGVILLAGLICFGVSLAILKSTDRRQEEVVEPIDQENLENPEDLETKKEPEILAIDFQPVVDAWVNSIGGNKSVAIYDLDLKKMAGSYNAAESYNTASLYKLFVVYEGYKRVATGEWDGNEKAGYTGKTILECLDLAIRESNSECAETIRGLIGWNNLNSIISGEWGIVNSNIPKLISNPNDIALMMQRFYEHPDFNNTVLIDRMWDSFLNQPVTEYDWRQGLPKGFSRALVYNKVGWDFNPDINQWNIYHDAAIVKFSLEDGTTRNFVVVVMTNKVDFRNIRKFGTDIENKFYEEIKI